MLAVVANTEPPPLAPVRPVWSDNITSIDAPNPCAGSRATIHGRNFGFPKPADVGLIAPINGVCTPIDVDPSDWTDTKITFTLPAGITSGSVGFVDLAYVKAYNAWVDRVNAAADAAIAAAKCAKTLPPNIQRETHFSQCAPATPFNRLRAGSAFIRSFTVNLSVAEPTDVLSLSWDVVNAESFTVQRTSANGPLLAGSTVLANPIPFYTLTLGSAGHTGPDTFTYLLTATGPCGIVTATVTVVATKQPKLSIASIEVTQGIQTVPPSVKLVSQKPTVVRVTVNHQVGGWGSSTVPNVTGRIKVQILGNPWSSWFDPVNGSNPIGPVAGATINAPASPQRANTNDTLNFLIPPAYCAGDVVILVEIRVTGFDARPGVFAGWSESLTSGTPPGLLTFEPRHILNLRYVKVRWGSVVPSDSVCQATLLSAIPLIPTPMAIVAPLGGVGVQTPANSFPPDRDKLLDDFYDLHNCSAWEMATEFLGSECPDEDDEIWVLVAGTFGVGRARNIPGNVCFTPPNDGPYMGHELSHCLNQIHVGVACPTTGQTAPGGQNPSTWPNNGVLSDVPFDVSTNSTVPGNGTTVWDVMTYCGTPTTNGGINATWPSPQRWQQLWDFNGA